MSGMKNWLWVSGGGSICLRAALVLDFKRRHRNG
jgi:hypothetical protein